MLASKPSTTMLELAQLAVACPNWLWCDGMLLLDDLGRITCADGTLLWANGDQAYRLDDAEIPLLPDLTDPATRGCLLELVRVAWSKLGYCFAYVHRIQGPPNSWAAHISPNRDPDSTFSYIHSFYGDSEAEVLVRILCAATDEHAALLCRDENAALLHHNKVHP